MGKLHPPNKLSMKLSKMPLENSSAYELLMENVYLLTQKHCCMHDAFFTVLKGVHYDVKVSYK